MIDIVQISNNNITTILLYLYHHLNTAATITMITFSVVVLVCIIVACVGVREAVKSTCKVGPIILLIVLLQGCCISALLNICPP
jgi:hypothetical protein